MAIRPFKARVTRDGHRWAFTIDNLEGSYQTKRLDRVPTDARKLVSAMTGRPPDSFEVEVIHNVPAEWLTVVAGYWEAKEAFETARHSLAATQRQAIARLLDVGLTHRDVGTMMGISGQRVSQLIGSDPELSSLNPGRATHE